MLNQSNLVQYVPIEGRDGVMPTTFSALFPIACIPKPFRYEYLKSNGWVIDREALNMGVGSDQSKR